MPAPNPTVFSSQSPTTYEAPVANLSTFLALQGWRDLAPDIYAADQAAQAKSLQLKQAVALYEAQPDSRNAKDLQQALLSAKEGLEKELLYAKKQRDLYQAQAQARAQQPMSYSLSGGMEWALHGIKDFFGSSPEALAEKYAIDVEKKEARLVHLDAGIALLEREAASLKKEQAEEDHLPAGPSRHLLSTTSTNSTAVTVANPIPNQVIEIGQSYTYSLNNVFSGDYTLLSATGLPSWLSLQYPHISNYTALSEASAVALSSSTLFVAGCNFSIPIGSCNSSLLILDISTLSTPILLGSYTTHHIYSSFNDGYHRLIVSNNTIFWFIQWEAWFLIVDVSTPSHSQLLCNYTNLSSVNDLAVSGNRVFVADPAIGLVILDVSTPTQPLRLGSYAPSRSACAIATSGSTAFLVTSDHFFPELLILDVTIPNAPSLLGSYTNPFLDCNTPVISGSTLFFTDGFGFDIVNISALNNPQLLGGYWGLGMGDNKIIVLGNTLFSDSLSVFDVSTPNNPALLMAGISGLGLYSSGFTVSGSTAFIAGQGAGVLVFDLSQGELVGSPPTGNPQGEKVGITVSARNFTGALTNTVFTLTLNKPPYLVETTVSDQSILPGHPLSLYLRASLFVNPSNSFLRLSVQSNAGQQPPGWLLSLTLTPLAIGSYSPNIGVSTTCVVLSGNTLFLGHSNGLSIIDVSVPSTPQLLGQYGGLSWSVNDVFISDDIAFVADSNSNAGLFILNVSIPSAPKLLGNYTSTNLVSDVAVLNNLVFLATAGLIILDVSTLSTPVLLANYSAGSWSSSNSVVVSGNTVFLTGPPLGLSILDISIPSKPQLLSSFAGQYSSIGSGGDIVLLDSTVFLSTYSEGLIILDVSLLTHPQLVNIPLYSGVSGITGMAISSHTLFVTMGKNGGLTILDVSTPSVPQKIGGYSYVASSLSLDYQAIAISDSTVFIGDLNAGLIVLDVSQWLLTTIDINSYEVAQIAGNYPLQLVATDALGGMASASFTIRIEGSPQVLQPIPLQYAPVGQSFNYFVPQGVFYDPNGDPISFTAFQTNKSTLPAWLSFNGISASFVGNPGLDALGIWSLTINATDNVAGTPTTSTAFFIFVGNPIPATTPLHAGRPFNFSVPESTLPASTFAVGARYWLYQAEPLQPWITFNEGTLTFQGTPPFNTTKAFTLSLNVIATIPFFYYQNYFYTNQKILAPMSFLVVPNSPLQIVPISIQTATVGTKFSLVVSPNTFTNPNGYPLTYSAKNVPGWMTFNASVDPPTFSGTPGHGDTDFYALRIVQISLFATDGIVNGSTVFTQQVGGVSTGQRVITIVAPMISAFSAMFTAYRLRALALNRCFKERYQKLDQAEVHQVGEEFSVQLSTPSEKIYGVAVKMPTTRKRGCSHFFRLPRALPGGFALPHWMEYDPDTNRLQTKQPIPKGADKNYVVQVCGKGGVILEQFDFNISPNHEIEMAEAKRHSPSPHPHHQPSASVFTEGEKQRKKAMKIMEKEQEDLEAANSREAYGRNSADSSSELQLA